MQNFKNTMKEKVLVIDFKRLLINSGYALNVPNVWYESHVISTLNEAERDQSSNCRRVSPLNTGKNLCTVVMNAPLQIITEVLFLQNYSGVRNGRSCTDKVFTLNESFERRRWFNMEIYWFY
jgi:hypothetical protein